MKDEPLTPATTKFIERVQRITAKLPGTQMEIDGFGHRAFRVGKKSIAMIGQWEQKPTLSIKSDPATQDALIRQGGYERTPYIGQHGWVSVADTAQADWNEIEQLLLDAYRAVAPKKLLAQLE